MVKESYVSSEIYSLMKQKGFAGWERAILCGEDGDMRNWGYTEAQTFPSLSVAMKWLREVHHIFLSIQQHMDTSYVWYAYVDGVAKGCDRESHNNTYEETCEASIKYCLENLI